ncbi:hypothetical protein BG005_000216 [Podila minutissima]|nr:hypothetical protein BG005_000216 [Podila minutissima]
MTSQDYRVSTIVVLCKDCGNDVGMYPGRHKCRPADRPPMPAMPSIPLQYQQSQPQSYQSSSSSRTNGRRPPDLNPQLANSSSSYSSSYGSSRTPTNASFQDRANGNRTPTASSFQERMKERDREKQQREREEREAARREDPRLDASPSSTTPTPTPAAATGTTLWNRLRAAKEVINATITGEEKWPDSDDSDFEGESHVSRVLRERLDKKEEAEMAAKIAELEMTPYNASGSQSKASGRNQYLRDATRKESAPSIASSTSSGGDDPYSRSLRSRADTGAQESDRSWSPSSNNTYGSNNNSLNVSGNRYRTTSDASRDDALSRLEGKSDGDRLNTQISHLGSTSPRVRANSPNMGFRPDAAAQQQYNQQLSPSSANNNYNSPSNRQYDSPSPSPSGSTSRYAAPQQPSPTPSHRKHPPYSSSPVPSSSSLRSDAYNRSQPSSGRPEYERRPTFPPTTNPPPSNNNNNLGAYGQRQQYQKYQQQQQQYGSNQGNYF